MPNQFQEENAAEQYSRFITEFDGRTGKITRTTERNLWWRADGDTELVLFSKRADGAWRPFPGPADGPGLRMAPKKSKVRA